jgi:hypothetical protein
MSGLVKVRKTVSPESIIPPDNLSDWTRPPSSVSDEAPVRAFDTVEDALSFLARDSGASAMARAVLPYVAYPTSIVDKMVGPAPRSARRLPGGTVSIGARPSTRVTSRKLKSA